MALTNVYSTTVKSKDYKIYLTNVASTITVYDGTSTTTIADRILEIDDSDGNTITNLLTLTDISSDSTDPLPKLIFNEVGELRKDSIVNTISEGNTVEGNNLGKIVIDKNGELVFEIIARNKALLDQLDTMDGTTVCVLKVDKDLTEGKFYADLPFRYNESSTGGEVSAITLTFKKMVDSADDFSTLLPVE